jgi:hypothetical protein
MSVLVWPKKAEDSPSIDVVIEIRPSRKRGSVNNKSATEETMAGIDLRYQ